jgi:hypothetical protein
VLGDSGTSDEAARNLLTLCDTIGPRFAGTDGYRRAAAFMLKRFKACLLDRAELEPFAITAFRRGTPARLRIAGGRARDLPCYALPYGSATGGAGVTAAVIDVGGGSAVEIEARRKAVSGRLVLTDGRAAHRTAIYGRCEALGATGLVLCGTAEGGLLSSGCATDGRPGTIPAVSVGCESAHLLRRMMRHGEVRLTLATDATFEPAMTWNVVGELRGTERPDERVIVGGHLDSQEIGPGAFDNAAGVVMVMEIARLLARQRRHLKRTVRFIGFGAEEIGLLGSRHHARAHAAELRRTCFMLNCDTPSLGRPMGLAFHRCPGLAAYVGGLAAEMGTEIVCPNRQHRHSDHYPFVLRGVPTAGIAGGPVGQVTRHFGHTAADTPEKIPTTDLREAAAFAARILLRAASDERWPRARRSAADVKWWREKEV